MGCYGVLWVLRACWWGLGEIEREIGSGRNVLSIGGREGC